MNIFSLNAFFVYKGGYKLDLMNAPPPTEKLAEQYNYFLQNMSIIYGEQRSNGSIPIFYTRQTQTQIGSTTTIISSPDPNSTLKELIPGESYYFIPRSQRSLPLTIPQTPDFLSFIKIDETSSEYLKFRELITLLSIQSNVSNPANSIGIQAASALDCCPKITVKDLSKDGKISINGFNGIIKLEISNLVPNELYYYFVDSLFSNWPVKITPSNGSIRKSGPVDANGFVSTTISLFYTTYKTIYDTDSGIFDYSIPDPSKYRYNQQTEIETTINATIVHSDANKCLPVSEIFKVNPILPSTSCHNVSIVPSNNIVLNKDESNEYNIQYSIHAILNNLDSDLTYKYYFRNKSSSWPANIKPLSGIINPSNRNRGTANIHALFSFCPSGSPESCANIDFTYVGPTVSITSGLVDSSLSTEQCSTQPTSFIRTTSPSIYSNIELVVEPVGYALCSGVVADLSVVCNKCMPYEDQIEYIQNSSDIQHENLSVSINTLQNSNIWPFNKTNFFQFPNKLSATDRPLAEINVFGDVCKQPILIEAFVTGVVSGEKYTVDWNAYIPGVEILPKNSVVKFDRNNALLYASGYLNGNSSSPIDVTISHEPSKTYITDFSIIRCYQQWNNSDFKVLYQPEYPSPELEYDLPSET